MDHSKLPADPAVAKEVITAQSAASRVKLDRGIIGVILGTKDHAPNNVAGTVVVASLTAIIYLAASDSEPPHHEKAISILMSILSMFGGFMFGRSVK
ncbi:hypothetical protein ABIC16_003709 [Sphingomonas sp. PvP055]|uniref:hypothetical protein n=1 Tax=Sphingomonas sp. PvP055 TaxID=3156391 RepID=UPI003394C8F5